MIWYIIRNIIFNIEKSAANICVETYEILWMEMAFFANKRKKHLLVTVILMIYCKQHIHAWLPLDETHEICALD